MKKNYSFYKKTEEVYLSPEFAFPIAVIVMASAITYVCLYFLGITVAILFNVFISFCGNFFFYYYGKSSTTITLEFLIRVALTTAFFLFIDYGVYALVIYQETDVFNKLYFYIWLTIIVGGPFLYYVFQHSSYYFQEKSMAVTYIKVFFKVHHDRELLTYIDTIQFVNTARCTMSDIKLEKPNCFYSESELNKMDSSDRNYYTGESVFSEMIHLPFDADTLFMSWYSIIEDKYYDIEVPFPFEKLVIEQEKYPTNVSAVLRGKKTKKLNLHIHENGGIRLFNEDEVLIDLPESIPAVISEEQRNEKIEFHRLSHEYYSDPKAFSSLIEAIRASGGIEERFQIQNTLVSWSMSISGLEGNYYFDMLDVSSHKYKSEKGTLELPMFRFLPKKLEMVYRGDYLYRWLVLRINYQKLYQSIQKLTDGNEKSSVLFDLVFENSSKKTDLKFTLTVNGKSEVFTNWEMQIDKNHKQSMQDHLLDVIEDETRRTLLKEAWALVGKKKYALAQEKCNALLTLDPRYGYGYFLESRLLWYKEGFEACYAKKDYFIEKTKHEPAALAHIYNNYGCILDLELRYEESKSYFEKAIETYPKEGLYVCNLAEMYCKLKDPKKAMEYAEKSRKLGYESETLNLILESKGTHDFVKMRKEYTQ